MSFKQVRCPFVVFLYVTKVFLESVSNNLGHKQGGLEPLPRGFARRDLYHFATFSITFHRGVDFERFQDRFFTSMRNEMDPKMVRYNSLSLLYCVCFFFGA